MQIMIVKTITKNRNKNVLYSNILIIIIYQHKLNCVYTVVYCWVFCGCFVCFPMMNIFSHTINKLWKMNKGPQYDKKVNLGTQLIQSFNQGLKILFTYKPFTCMNHECHSIIALCTI